MVLLLGKGESWELLRRFCGGGGVKVLKRKAPAFSGFGESVQRFGGDTGNPWMSQEPLAP